jgi:hypothetical protein
MSMEKTKQLVKEYETKGKIKVDWETGTYRIPNKR